MSDIQEVTISHRALSGSNKDDLYTIPVELADKDEFQISHEYKFVRCRGGVYTFPAGWQRADGEACEAEPEKIYAMGHLARLVVTAA